MTLEDIALLAEIAGAIVVAVTLIFLTLQMMQNNKMLRSSATQHAHSEFGSLYDSLLADVSFMELYFRAIENYAALTDVEKGWMNAFWMKATINYQNWLIQTKEGALDPVVLKSYELLTRRVLQTDSFQAFWRERMSTFSPALIRRVDDLMNDRAPDSYVPLGVK